MLLEPLLSAVLTSAVALLFLGALVHKLRDWPGFVAVLGAYRLMPRAAVAALAPAVALAETAVVIGSFVPATHAAALGLAALLLGAYALAMAANLARGRVLLDCGCGGFGQRQRLAWWMVRRNVLLVALALLASRPAAPGALGLPELFVIASATAAAAGLYLAHATLAANRQLAAR